MILKKVVVNLGPEYLASIQTFARRMRRHVPSSSYTSILFSDLGHTSTRLICTWYEFIHKPLLETRMPRRPIRSYVGTMISSSAAPYLAPGHDDLPITA